MAKTAANDRRYMRIAIDLARKGLGQTSPNPTVGAVVVRLGRIVGKGYHRGCGLPHAEVNALRDAGSRARGATMYVTLEPCNHYGRTPPCTGPIITSGIRRVVIAMKDPNPVTDGKGIRALMSRGIRVETGVLSDEARELNRPFIKFMQRGLPYVTLKMAQSIDGKIATRTGDSRWITAEDSRAYVHDLRRMSDAVMVGVNTVAADDPMLLARRSGTRQPARVIVDSMLRTPVGSRIFSTAGVSPVIVAAAKRAGRAGAAKYIRKGASVIFAKESGGRVDLRDLLKRLAGMGYINILAEGGGELAAGLIERDLVDRVLIFIAPKIIGGKGAITSVEGAGSRRIADAVDLHGLKVRRFSRDILLESDLVDKPRGRGMRRRRI
jgi:diaminohydroxyphosphoribosylaminopyrimidine deaminase/5-amino-6-(5-phosphoribosylamino)uracil reductase